MNTSETNVPSTATGSAQPAAASQPPSNLGRVAVVVVLLVIVGLLVGFIPRFAHRRALDKETAEFSTPLVRVVTATTGKAADTLVLPAEARAYTEAPIYARAAGYIKHWYLDIGAHVSAGDLLADIDTPELDQQLAETKANLVQAEAAQALSKITAERWAELLKTASVSEQENAEKQADLKLKEANVDAARANVNRLEDLFSYTHVTAPFSGTLTVRNIDVGDLISSGKELFRLADTSKLRVFVRVPQTATPDIAVGAAATLTISELPSRKFTAKVVRTAGSIDTASRTLLTELEVDNPKNEILPGSYVQVSFADMRPDATFVLPANTLLFRAEGTQVGVVKPDGHVELRQIVIGRDFGRTLEILSGITATDRVIFNPPDAIVSGEIVKIAEESAVTNK
jgi:membrane fusion protein (multidrug efflux system)